MESTQRGDVGKPIGSKRDVQQLARSIARTRFPVPMKDGRVLMASGTVCSICLGKGRSVPARYWLIPLHGVREFGTAAIVCRAHEAEGREMVLDDLETPYTVWMVTRSWLNTLNARPLVSSR